MTSNESVPNIDAERAQERILLSHGVNEAFKQMSKAGLKDFALETRGLEGSRSFVTRSNDEPLVVPRGIQYFRVVLVPKVRGASIAGVEELIIRLPKTTAELAPEVLLPIPEDLSPLPLSVPTRDAFFQAKDARGNTARGLLNDDTFDFFEDADKAVSETFGLALPGQYFVMNPGDHFAETRPFDLVEIVDMLEDYEPALQANISSSDVA